MLHPHICIVLECILVYVSFANVLIHACMLVHLNINLYRYGVVFVLMYACVGIVHARMCMYAHARMCRYVHAHAGSCSHARVGMYNMQNRAPGDVHAQDRRFGYMAYVQADSAQVHLCVIVNVYPSFCVHTYTRTLHFCLQVADVMV